MIQKFLLWLRGVVDKMIGLTDVGKKLDVNIALSETMATAIRSWTALYENKAGWLSKEKGVYSLNLPAAIAGEIARSITIEMKVEVSGSSRATFLQEIMDRVVEKLRRQIEYVLTET